MKWIRCIVVFLMAASPAMASRMDEVTLIVVPREDGAVRVGMDVANHYPTLLLSYKLGAGGAVSLHGWNGSEWVNVSLEDFQSGNFFRTGPQSALLVERGDAPMPAALVPPEAWCGPVYKITTTEVRPLLHLTGQYFDFNYKDWKWFSENYRFPIESINPEGLNIAWYHRRLNEQLARDAAFGANDLQFWFAVRHPVPAAMGGEVVGEGAASVAEEISATNEVPVVDGVNPLTNAAPEAVVMGANAAESAPAVESADSGTSSNEPNSAE